MRSGTPTPCDPDLHSPPMHGLHLTADLRQCRRDAEVHALLTDAATLEALCRVQVAVAGLHAVQALFHRFDLPPGEAGPAGVTGVVLLAESHLAVHTWPELDAVTIDVYVCNFGRDNSTAAHRLMDALVAAFAPAHVQRHALERGRDAALTLPTP